MVVSISSIEDLRKKDVLIEIKEGKRGEKEGR